MQRDMNFRLKMDYEISHPEVKIIGIVKLTTMMIVYTDAQKDK